MSKCEIYIYSFNFNAALFLSLLIGSSLPFSPPRRPSDAPAPKTVTPASGACVFAPMLVCACGGCGQEMGERLAWLLRNGMFMPNFPHVAFPHRFFTVIPVSDLMQLPFIFILFTCFLTGEVCAFTGRADASRGRAGRPDVRPAVHHGSSVVVDSPRGGAQHLRLDFHLAGGLRCPRAPGCLPPRAG